MQMCMIKELVTCTDMSLSVSSLTDKYPKAKNKNHIIYLRKLDWCEMKTNRGTTLRLQDVSNLLYYYMSFVEH